MALKAAARAEVEAIAALAASPLGLAPLPGLVEPGELVAIASAVARAAQPGGISSGDAEAVEGVLLASGPRLACGQLVQVRRAALLHVSAPMEPFRIPAWKSTCPPPPPAGCCLPDTTL